MAVWFDLVRWRERWRTFKTKKMKALIKYNLFLKQENRKPKVGDLVYTVINGNFTKVKITSIDENGWLYVFHQWLINKENCYIEIDI